MATLDEIRESFESVQVPKPRLVRDPHHPGIEAEREAYFERVKASLGMSYLAMSETVNVVSDEHLRSSATGVQYNHHLWFDGHQQLASMVRHDQANGLQVVRFVRHRLQPKTAQAIQGYHEADDALTRILFKR